MSRQRRKKILETMPHDFRERYFSLFTGPEPETLHSELYQMLIDDGTDAILGRLKEYSKRRRKLVEKVQERIKVGRIIQNDESASIRVVASDAGNNGVDLRSAYVPLYASAAIAVEGWKIIGEPVFKAGPPDVWSDEFRVQQRESLLAFKIQYEITKEAVRRWEPELVIFDGSLLLNFWLLPLPEASKAYHVDFKKTLISSAALLQTCLEKRIPIVGFAKRTRINHICKSFKAPKLRDTALMDLILRVGEYTIPEPEPMKGTVVRAFKRQAKEQDTPSHLIAKMTNIYSSYIRTGFTTPFRLEIPEYCLDRLEEIATVLCTTSEEEYGIPFSLNEADRLTKMTTRISNIRTLMIYSKALDSVKQGEMDQQDLNMLSLQHGEPWAINDGSFMSNISGRG